MHIKKWITFFIIIGFFGITFVWMKGASQTNGGGIQISQVSSNVPAPGPGQKKVVFKNLGMS